MGEIIESPKTSGPSPSARRSPGVREQTGAIGERVHRTSKRAPYRRFSSIERNRAKNLNSAEHALNLAAEAATTSNAGSARADGKIMEPSGSTALLVLGMHRSGTSSMAGAMVRLGGAAPLNLLPPADDNPKGFWESSVLMTLNDQILAAGGSHWEDWRQFDPARIDAAAAFALKARQDRPWQGNSATPALRSSRTPACAGLCLSGLRCFGKRTGPFARFCN